VAILDDPFQGLTLLQFQRLSQGSRANEVELAGLVGALDDLDFGEIAHKSMITLAIQLVKRLKLIFSHDRGDAEGAEKVKVKT